MNNRKTRIWRARHARVVVGLALIALALIVVGALTSCSSIFDAAVDSMIDRETDKAVAETQTEEESGSATASSQTAPQTVDPSVHRIVGAWVNPDYNDEERAARLVYSLNADGTFTYMAFDRLDGGEVYEGTVTYISTWVDEAGRSCGECTVTLDNGMSWRTLDRISVDGNTLEVQSGVRTINPQGPRYSIYYRP